ncbi:MAG: hypothetical protein KDK60_02605 [Chlamydiia bacterium]|nr:hypothetical protein [Chlamydiia bacterium]
MKTRSYFFAMLLTLPLVLMAEGEMLDFPGPSFLDSNQSLPNEPRLMINNRPLAKINGKVISLYDVVKKMDLFLYDYYPDYKPNAVEKFQFYMSRWEATLDEMISNQLILIDAEKKEIKINDGDLREEFEERFGPNVMINLDKVNLQYEEAREMIREELTVQQLIGMKVHSKAFQSVTPQVIKGAYETYLAQNPPEDEWKYQVLSIRGSDEALCETIASKAYQLLEEKKGTLEEIARELEEEGVTITVSEDYSGPTSKISKQHLTAIESLLANTFSSPISQVSRFDNRKVYRIFHLKEAVKNLPKSFQEMHDQLKNELLYKRSDKEKENYIQALKKRYGYDAYQITFDLPDDYRPFALL